MPKSLDFSEAAALPLTSITAWEGLFDRLGISLNANKNKNILIIGAAGGVGSMAVQLAKFAGLTVIGTASRPESTQWVKSLGADIIINHNNPFQPQLKAMGIDTIDYIFCLNDTVQHMANMAEVIAPQGIICCIVPADKDSWAGNLNVDLLFSKSVTFVWEFMFTRSLFHTKDMIEQHKLLNNLADLIDDGKLKTTLTERLEPINAANLRLAHEKLETGRSIGKIVLENF